MKEFALAGAAVAMLAIPAAARQAPAHAGAQPITRALMQDRIEARFVRADANHDGFLDAAEARSSAAMRAPRGQRQAVRGERRAGAFARLDADRNGVINQAEFAAQGDGAARQMLRQQRQSRRNG